MTETASATEVVAPGSLSAAPAARQTGSRPRWELPALGLLLIITAVAYCWDLSATGWGNDFYAAAVQSGTQSWKAFFFGSLDPGNIVTVDKTPLSLWPMELSGRIFGFSSLSMLLPEVVLGVASVALLRASVRRSFGPAAGLLAGLVLALTPVAALMFRYNNPDAMLTFLIIAAAWAMTRALGDGRWRWLALTGAFIGLGFLAKQLQVMLVVPGLVLGYLVAGPPRLGKRLAQLCAAGVAVVVSAGWWVLAAQLWPASSRPYFGGSQNNSILDLTVGYNGIQRLDTSGFGPRAGTPGITRLFGPELAGQITWLVPAALVLGVAGIALRGRAGRTDGARGALVLWGVWLVVAGLVFSFMNGTFHQYYTLTMAPAIAALIGGGAVLVWRERDRVWPRAALAVSMLLTVAMAWVTLSRTPDFVPWLRWVVLVAGIVAAVAVVVPVSGRVSAVVLGLAILVGLAGPVSYTVDTLASGHSGDGGGFAAGPQVPGASMFGGPPGGGHHGGGHRGGAQLPGDPGAGSQAPGRPGTGAPGAGMPMPGGAPGGPGHGGGPGGWDQGPSQQVVNLLKTDAGRFIWPGAAVSSHGANSYQLAAGVPVMSIGGFSGGDPAPTLAHFQQYVAQRKIHYFIAGGFHGPDSDDNSESAKIAAWVQQHYTAKTVDGVTMYDLSGAAH
ncbi:ArnT family glycosyltransferase [Nocardia alni]|uniref:ArnT family glycosyltransferase n=1 Tax=Nocardia alni TaxID=2815723 RepID=UPI001C2325E5|nr:glycosyltransferase family 39 protein [Nocardia alni]